VRAEGSRKVALSCREGSWLPAVCACAAVAAWLAGLQGRCLHPGRKLLRPGRLGAAVAFLLQKQTPLQPLPALGDSVCPVPGATLLTVCIPKGVTYPKRVTQPGCPHATKLGHRCSKIIPTSRCGVSNNREGHRGAEQLAGSWQCRNSPGPCHKPSSRTSLQVLAGLKMRPKTFTLVFCCSLYS